MFAALARTVRQTSTRQLVRVPFHINDAHFSAAVVQAFRTLHGARGQRRRARLTMARIERSHILEKFRAMVARGEPIVGGGAGTGLSAKCEEAGGIDLIVIYNSGRYRMAGRGSLAGLMPYGDANQIVVEMAADVLPVVKHTPVLAGVNGTDPFRQMDIFLDQLKAMGFSGVQNFPTVGLIDGTFRANLEETGMSYGLEVDMIAHARAKDLLTTPYVFNEEDAAAMAQAGADIIVCHLGLTTGGTIGAQDRADARRVSGAGRCLGRGGAEGAPRRDRPGARRAGGGAGRRGVRHAEYQELPRLLWRLLDGAIAGRGSADGADEEIQADRARLSRPRTAM